jgi:hypothetical protein
VTFRASSQAGNGATSGSSTITIPVPSDAVAGDAAVMATINNFDEVTISSLSRAGWTHHGPYDATSGNRLHVWTKVLTSGDISAGNVLITFSASTRAVGGMSVFNVGGVSDPFGEVLSDNSGTTMAPTVVTTELNSDVMFIQAQTTGGPGQAPAVTFPDPITTDRNPRTNIATGTNVGISLGHLSTVDLGSHGGGTMPGANKSTGFTSQTAALEIFANVLRADAGPDQSVQPGVTVTLDGSGSTSGDGGGLSYTWTQIGGPTVSLSGSGATRTFTAPTLVGGATLTFQLTVADGDGTDSDTVTITVASYSNTASAGDGATSSVSSLEVPIPPTAQAGDAAVLTSVQSFNGVTASAPSGWAAHGPYDCTQGNRIYVWTKILTSGDISGETVEITFSSTTCAVAAITAVPTSNTTDPFGPIIGGGSKTTNAQTVSTVRDNSKVIQIQGQAFAGPGQAPAVTFSRGSTDENPRSDRETNANVGLSLGHIDAPSAGTYGGGTLIGASNDAGYASQSMAIEVRTEAADNSEKTTEAGNGATLSVSSLTVPLPAGAAAGYAAVLVSTNNWNAVDAEVSGWSHDGTFDVTSGNRLNVWRKVLTASDINAGSVTIEFSTTTRCVAAMYVYDVDGTPNPFGPIVGGGTNTVTAQQVTTTKKNSVVVQVQTQAFAGDGQAPKVTFANGVTDANPRTNFATGVNMGLSIGHINAPTVGTYGGGTMAGASAAVNYSSQPIAFWIAGPQELEADAGPDQTGVEPFSTVTLDGSNSTSGNGNSLSYLWTQTGGAPVDLAGSGAERTFEAPATLTGATLTFQLRVNNGVATSAADTMQVQVAPHTIWTIAASGGMHADKPIRRTLIEDD